MAADRSGAQPTSLPQRPSPNDASSWPAVMTTDVAAGLLGMNEQTLRAWLREGRVRGHRTGRRWHVLRDELIEDIAGPHGRPGGASR